MLRVISVAALAIMAVGTAAEAQSISTLRQRCNAQPRNCRNMPDGPNLQTCLTWNANIQHACNQVRDYEARSGKGPKYRDATKKGGGAGELDEADQD